MFMNDYYETVGDDRINCWIVGWIEASSSTRDQS